MNRGVEEEACFCSWIKFQNQKPNPIKSLIKKSGNWMCFIHPHHQGCQVVLSNEEGMSVGVGVPAEAPFGSKELGEETTGDLALHNPDVSILGS